MVPHMLVAPSPASALLLEDISISDFGAQLVLRYVMSYCYGPWQSCSIKFKLLLLDFPRSIFLDFDGTWSLL